AMNQSVYAVATMDTKGHELEFVAERLRAAGVAVVTVDVGTMSLPVVHPDVDRATVALGHPTTAGRHAALAESDRGQAITAMGEALEAQGFDCLVFHATGTGGRAMEQLVEAGLIGGVLDITTTEVADEVGGGILPAGPHRFEAILRAKVPYVLSLGALDMVNFGAVATVPERCRDRRLHVHNAQVTLMRTTPEENRRCARWIAAELNRAEAPF